MSTNALKMGKNKLAKFADMAAYPHVFEPANTAAGMAAGTADETPFALRGRWNADFFHRDAPIVLELGCGRGEYTVGLARLFPDKHFIGGDIKGARMWTGATESLNEGMTNVAFLRTHIEFIDRYFAPGEVSEIWITFPDPQMKKATKRLTSSFFLERYRRLLCDGGCIHLKTDSPFLYTYTHLLVQKNGLPTPYDTDNLYGDFTDSCTDEMRRILSIRTYYESQWLARGLTIKYIRFHLPHQGVLAEPEVDIPLDEYRSYNRSKRSGLATSR